MSAADQIGKNPTPGPAGVVQLVLGFANAILTQNRKKQYKVDGKRVSKEQFGGGGGGNVLQQAAEAAARLARPVAAVSPPTATRPSDPGYRPDLTEPRLPPLKRTPSPPKPPPQGPSVADRPSLGPGGRPVPPIVSKAVQGFMRAWLGRAGVAVSAVATVAYLIDLWFRTFPGQPLPDKPPPRGGGPGSQGGKGTQRPQLPPEIIFNPTININIPPQGSPREPAKPKIDVLSPIVITARPIPSPPLRPIKVTAQRLPIPKPPPSVYEQLLTKYGPTALPLLGGLVAKDKKKKKKPTSAPVPSVPGLTPGITPGLGLQPTPADFPLYSGGSYFDSTPQSKTCDCAPKKKRGPKKKRTKCYTGRFTERANGLRKYEKRAIKCR